MSAYDYGLLDALAAVMREGTFEAAARSLNVTQSAVSQRIKQLEERLGGIVVVRGRPCAPTELGLQLYNHVEQVRLLEHQLNRTIDSKSNQHGNQAAILRIAVNSDSLSTWFPSVVRRASRELLVHFDIVADDQEHTNDKLTSGSALAAITASEVPIQGFRRTPLGSMEYLAVASQEYAAKYFPDGVTINAIKDAPSILFDRKDTLPVQWLLRAFGETVNISGHMVPSFDGYMGCCLNGTGWGMMPTSAVERYIANGRMVEIMPNTRIQVPLHWQSSTKSSEILKQLASIVVEEARKALGQQSQS